MSDTAACQAVSDTAAGQALSDSAAGQAVSDTAAGQTLPSTEGLALSDTTTGQALSDTAAGLALSLRRFTFNLVCQKVKVCLPLQSHIQSLIASGQTIICQEPPNVKLFLALQRVRFYQEVQTGQSLSRPS